MNAIGLDREGKIRTGIDQKLRARLAVFISHFCYDGYHCACQQFEFATRKIFFAELDVIDLGENCFANLLQQVFAAIGFISGKCGPIGDVVEKAAFRHKAFSFLLLAIKAHPERFVAPSASLSRYGRVLAISGKTSP
jgi:hypothetical protein